MKEQKTLLIINCGSTSTKVSIFHNYNEVLRSNISYSIEEINKFKNVSAQLDMRKESVMKFLEDKNIKYKDLDIVMSRGGSTFPTEGGAYEINDIMVSRLRDKPFVQHAGILGPVIARYIADLAGVKSYVYDSPSTCELTDIAKISGMKEIERVSLVHTLNTRYVCRKICKELNKDYEKLNIIAAHLGGGITISLHSKGKIIDVVGDGEGTFSPDRAGGIHSRQLVDLCFGKEYDSAAAVHKIMRGNGGLVSYLGTNDVVEIEDRIDSGDKYALLIYDAMIYQLSKSIVSLAPVVDGKLDFIVLTGSLAKSCQLVEKLKKHISFLAEIKVLPGDMEMEALCYGGMKILEGKEQVKNYTE
ncbi:butyrate kinase [Paratissierella segnis]|jgi:butyrate kinase|uniref:Probable butyrate kinase n=1 Tax=Paratissierella segnis TaxID=2763679 RepID=A0A926EU44_9FIRM|nr:butyrate kinase [Paratissierella segnis]MBC8588941.1 butyrate kinase [Paratissierella segnis]